MSSKHNIRPLRGIIIYYDHVLFTFDPNTSVVANYSFFANNKHVTLVCRRSMTFNIRAKYMHIWSTEKLKQPFGRYSETSLSGHLKVFRHCH